MPFLRERFVTVILLTLVFGLLCTRAGATVLRSEVRDRDVPANQDTLAYSVSQEHRASVLPQGTVLDNKVIFEDGVEAPASVWRRTEVTVAVPSGAVSGPVVVETDRGDSNGVSFTTGTSSVPDASGEGTTWTTDVSGTIASDTTWSSNVRVTGDVEVAAGVTLTIEPGVTVFFAASSDARSTGLWTGKSELQVYGTLIAEGTEATPIYFTSGASQKATEDWGGVVIRRGSTDSSIAHCVIHYAENGVCFHSYNEGTTTIAGTVRNCAILDNTEGIHLDGEPSYSLGGTVVVQPRIVGNLVRDNTEIGISVRTCTGYGVARNYGVIEDNQIERNGIGIRSTVCSWWQGHASSSVEIRNNAIRDNSTYGLDIRSGGSTDNSGSDTNNQTVVENNLLEGNDINIFLLQVPYGSDGTQILSPTIRYNTIRDAPYGVVVSDTEPYDTLTATISHNVFYGLSGYAVDNQTSRPIYVSENYWGDTESEWDAGPQAGDLNGNVTASNHLVSTSPPVVTRIAPGIGQVGDQVVLYGANFGTVLTLHLPLVMRNHTATATFPLHIGDPIPRRSVSYQGEIFCTQSLRIPDVLPPGGHYFFSSQSDTLAEVLVDDELAIILNGVQLYAYDFSTGGSPASAVVALPQAIMDQLPGQTVVIEYRDIYGEVVQASAMWLIWVP